MQLIVYRLGSLASLAASTLFKIHQDKWRNVRRNLMGPTSKVEDPSYDRIIPKRSVGRWFQEKKSVPMKDIDIVLMDVNYSPEDIYNFAKQVRAVYVFSREQRTSGIDRPSNVFELVMSEEQVNSWSMIQMVCDTLKINYDTLLLHYRLISMADTHSAPDEESLREAQSFVMGYRHFYETSSEGFFGMIENSAEELDRIFKEIMQFGTEFRHHADDDITRAFDARPKRLVKMGAFKVPIINMSRRLVSLVYGPRQYKPWDFVLFYEDLGSHRHFEMRTIRDDINLRHLAERYGGGGRPKAAGFTIPVEQAYKEGLY